MRRLWRGLALTLFACAILALVASPAWASLLTYPRASNAHELKFNQLRGLRLPIGQLGRGAAPLAATSPGYTLHYVFTADATDPKDYIASFTPDVKSIFAWATITADNGAAQQQFQVNIQFIAPNGQVVTSRWYNADTGNITSYLSTQTNISGENVARRQLDIAGTPNANLTGQWTVNFLVADKLVVAANFTLASGTDLASSDAVSNGRAELENSGYTVLEFDEQKATDGTLVAFVTMKMVSSDIYSATTSEQMVDGFAALRDAFRDAQTLLDVFPFNDRYDVLFYVSANDLDNYLASKDFAALLKEVSYSVYDKQLGQSLGTSSGDFVNKNFGAGSPQAPLNPPLTKKGGVGSVRVEISPAALPADGTSTADVKVTVYDKRNKTIPNAEVALAVSGSGSGVIRPKLTSTDDAGVAVAVFTAGTKSGSVNVTATVSATIGTGVLAIGAASTDPAKDNVIAYLQTQGLTATDVEFTDTAKTTVVVVIDLGTSFDINSIEAPVLYGLSALREFYPNATKLGVIIPYQSNYLVFPSSSAQFDAFAAALNAATTDADKNTVFENYLGLIFNQSALLGAQGNTVSSFKDFYNKSFGG